jgi:hypothetical protein
MSRYSEVELDKILPKKVASEFEEEYARIYNQAIDDCRKALLQDGEGEMKKSYIIAVDFDGTIVEHEYPKIGEPVLWAISVLQRIVTAGHKLILHTMRSGQELQEAVDYCKDNHIDIFAINENPTQKEWTSSPKIYAHYYIDDASVGCPVITNDSKRPYVNWIRVQELLEDIL